MAKRLPPLNPLRAFEATARHGSLTKAAARTQRDAWRRSATRSGRWKQSLGVKLFERGGQRLKLTPHGAELLPAVSDAFDGIAAATQRLTRPASTGTLSLSCVPALLSLWMIPRLGSFTVAISRHPADADRLQRSAGHPSPDIDLCVHLWRRRLDATAGCANGRASSCFRWSARR